MEENTTINEELLEEKQMSMSSDMIEKFDFSSEKELNIDEAHEIIKLLEKENPGEDQKEFLKLQEAKNIIAETAKNFLNSDFVDSYNKEEENLVNLIKKYDPNKDKVRSLPEEEKDKIYDIAQYLFNIYQSKLNGLDFDFPLTNQEYKFVNDVFRQKLEYDQNEIFQMKELSENYFKKDFPREGDIHKTNINVNDLIIFYHLLAKHKVKGMTSDYYSFLEVLTKIGERIKLFNAYNVLIQRLSTDFQVWGGSLSVEGDISGKVLEPQGISKEEIETEKVNG